MLGANDTMFCGLVLYHVDLTARLVEWSGGCVEGVCRMCASSISTFTEISICNDGRVCTMNELVAAPAGVLSWSYSHWFNPALLSAYIISLGVVVVVVAASIVIFMLQFCYLRLRYLQKKAKMH